MTDYASLHWQELKKRVEAAGFPWINKADAAEKLAALDDADAPEPDDPDAPGDPDAPTPDDPDAPDDADAPEPEVVAAKQSGPRLDRSKPYGQIGGEVENYPGACYAQGGMFFNSAGDHVAKV